MFLLEEDFGKLRRIMVMELVMELDISKVFMKDQLEFLSEFKLSSNQE